MPSAPAPISEDVDVRLGNGLRVVLMPDHAVPAVCTAVAYDVGTRSEPEDRTGFAHLFEHLMFQGSVNLEKMAHARIIEETGGSFNASTRPDSTVYHQILPSGGVERALFLEADRMRGPRITEENLRNQIDVVSEEIRVNVLNVPYGGFPKTRLCPVLFDTFPNAHDGYGSFEDLRSATVAEAEDFFHHFYSPSNAALVVTGDFDAEATLSLVHKHFADIPGRDAPDRPDFGEPDLTASRHHREHDPLTPLPAFASGWRVPDPIGEFAEFLPFVVLAEVLAGGERSRLVRRLVHTDHTVMTVNAAANLLGDPFGVRSPTGFRIAGYLPENGEVEPVLEVIREETDRLAADGLEPGELAGVRARMNARLIRNLDDLRARTVWATAGTLQRNRPRFAEDLPAMVDAVTAEQLAAAASTLVPERRATVEIVPGGTP
ncbi:peptidase M16 [Amycolatopsis antarctica]|uniref:Peptidase M16 n=1 Tax=Amycolatopsis antarctica TaxID=1854586 RepID=A0A263D2E0_9PSEU|nr:pitrilysin family protein [Amycolatopsis antarctica]OZM72620.1 peptidase M16 [Amycolatopsis antarctica]